MEGHTIQLLFGWPLCAGLQTFPASPRNEEVRPEADISAVQSDRSGAADLKRYGDQALKESAARATTLTLAGDDDGAATWHRIMAAVAVLANKTPPGRVH